MDAVERNPFGLSRAGVLMVTWGLLLLLAAALHQWGSSLFPSFEAVLAMWGLVTVLGLAMQGLCQLKYLKYQLLNYLVWVVAIIDGWAFTLFTIYTTQYQFYAELGPVWLTLLGLAYIPTAFQIDTRFFYLAGLHFVAAILLELAGRQILPIAFFNTYLPIIVGVVAGLSLAASAWLSRIRRERVQASAPATT